jgi:hypothetical protein
VTPDVYSYLIREGLALHELLALRLAASKESMLARADCLGDPWEIALPGEQLAHVISRHLLVFLLSQGRSEM